MNMKKLTSLVLVLVVALSLSVTPVLAETAPTQSIVEIAVGNPDFSILVSALQKADLVTALQGTGPFTVFAPTNAAFADLLAALDVSAEELLAQPDLAKVLLYHVVSGKVMSTDLSNGLEAATLNGEKVKFDLSGAPKVNDANITAVDIQATNGVIHVIDKVIVPSNFKLQDVSMTAEMPDTGDSQPSYIIAFLVAGLALLIGSRKLILARNRN
ncbi:MAG: fasciclin domain-containing protein [Clostridia bacterium]|nr:fasciclin domain-containing protein [Clostridia bacterium]